MPLANKGGPNYNPGMLFWAVEIVTVPAQTLIRLIALLCYRIDPVNWGLFIAIYFALQAKLPSSLI